ncbi:phosphatidylethanolamine N-methyltransferase [Ceratobasidium sp. 395]|nr:phosphatidylethanolamine N-methyltransferase [Ceratobasidium sp. 395]
MTTYLRWLAGFALIAMGLWSKIERYHIVKDYGRYWGDIFFERGQLVPDGTSDASVVFKSLFETALHPAYSVDPTEYYGLSLIAGSYALWFVGYWAQAMQYGFSMWFETPRGKVSYFPY